MKTPIQELIDEMQKHYEWQHTTFQEKSGIAICMSFCMKKLAKEKLTIINAHSEGIRFISEKTIIPQQVSRQYYTETFKNINDE